MYGQRHNRASDGKTACICRHLHLISSSVHQNVLYICCSEVADRLGLLEGPDFERVCLGEKGFNYVIDALNETDGTYGRCDVGVAAITVSSEREDHGIIFSRATHRSYLAVMVYAPLKQRGKWAFFEPLDTFVWIGIALTVVLTPLIVFFFEAVFNKRCAVFVSKYSGCA